MKRFKKIDLSRGLKELDNTRPLNGIQIILKDLYPENQLARQNFVIQLEFKGENDGTFIESPITDVRIGFIRNGREVETIQKSI